MELWQCCKLKSTRLQTTTVWYMQNTACRNTACHTRDKITFSFRQQTQILQAVAKVRIIIGISSTPTVRQRRRAQPGGCYHPAPDSAI